jgi:hypothetical protein
MRHLVCVLILFISGILSLDANADWTKAGSINGVQIYRDNDTDLEWTVSLSRVRSFGTAKQRVANLGFRVPTHREFKSLEHNGGIRRLGIDTAWAGGFYWEASGGLVNGNGGNFSSLFSSTRARAGDPYAIGVRKRPVDNENIPLPPPLPPPPVTGGNSPKVHMLFVWGTKATDTYWATMISKTKMEKALATESGVGLGKNEPHVANYITLEGNNATAKNINDISWRLSQEAGPNDAVLVYILCHGTTTFEDSDTNQQNRIHLLSPNCDHVKNMKPRELGIRRSTIWKNITSKPHRVNMLITDSCTPIYQKGKPGVVSPTFPGTTSVLYKVLMEGRGSLNINSADPNGNNEIGETAMAWLPIIQGKTGDAFLEEATERYEHSGTVFTNAFIHIAEMRIPINDRYTIDQFYGDLKNRLVVQFALLIKDLDKKNDTTIKTFEKQGTQTLTKFHDNGVAIKNEPESKGGAVAY